MQIGGLRRDPATAQHPGHARKLHLPVVRHQSGRIRVFSFRAHQALFGGPLSGWRGSQQHICSHSHQAHTHSQRQRGGRPTQRIRVSPSQKRPYSKWCPETPLKTHSSPPTATALPMGTYFEGQMVCAYSKERFPSLLPKKLLPPSS